MEQEEGVLCPVKDDTAQTSQKDDAAHSSRVGQALWLLELRSHGHGCTSAWSFMSFQTKVCHSGHVGGSQNP